MHCQSPHLFASQSVKVLHTFEPLVFSSCRRSASRHWTGAFSLKKHLNDAFRSLAARDVDWHILSHPRGSRLVSVLTNITFLDATTMATTTSWTPGSIMFTKDHHTNGLRSKSDNREGSAEPNTHNNSSVVSALSSFRLISRNYSNLKKERTRN